MERRSNQRLHINDLSVDASDGVGFLQGWVADASRRGVCVADLQNRRGGQPPQLTLVISGRNKNFKMNVRPKWSKVQGASRSVGAVIIDPPTDWMEFIMQFEFLR